jgi:hypothetical protein
MDMANRSQTGKMLIITKEHNHPKDDRSHRYSNQRRRSRNYDNYSSHSQVAEGIMPYRKIIKGLFAYSEEFIISLILCYMSVWRHRYTCGIKQPRVASIPLYYLIGQLMISFQIMWQIRQLTMRFMPLCKCHDGHTQHCYVTWSCHDVHATIIRNVVT